MREINIKSHEARVFWHVTVCQSFGEFLDLANSSNTIENDIPSSRVIERGSDSWYGSPDFATAQSLAINGVPELEAKVSALSERFRANIGHADYFLSFQFADSGDFVDVGRFLEGDPECFVQSVEQERHGQKVISIHLSAAASCAVSPQTFVRRGAAVAALVDCLIESGHSVDLTLDYCTRGDRTALGVVFPLLSAGDTFDLSRLTYGLIHPSCFRRHGFAAWEALPKQVREACRVSPGESYGYAATFDKLSEAGINPDIHLMDREIDAFGSDESAESWVRARLTEFGVLDNSGS